MIRAENDITDNIPQFSNHGYKNDLYNMISPVYTSIKDIKAVFDAAWPEVEELIKNIGIVSDNYYIQTCYPDVLKKFEAICGIGDENADIELRRFNVLALYSLTLPYSLPRLKEVLNATCGIGNWSITIDYNKYQLSIQILESFSDMAETLQSILIPIIPCHIEWVITKEITTFASGVGYYGGATYIVINSTVSCDDSYIPTKKEQVIETKEEENNNINEGDIING